MRRDGLVLLDAHVHIHDCYPLGSFLDHAHANLVRAAHGERSLGVLGLTEARGENAFLALCEAAAAGTTPAGANGWSLQRTAERISLRARSGAREMILLAGRQVQAREDLEVLLLGSELEAEDGLPIGKLLELGKERGALRVIPWGAGKWFFARGKLLDRILEQERAADFFLGDEGGRPALWREPRHFRTARALGIRNLPGSDPLPFAREIDKPGSYGVRVSCALDPETPGRSLLEHLRSTETPLQPYGMGEGVLRFVRNQLAMQLRKRRRRARARAAGGA